MDKNKYYNTYRFYYTAENKINTVVFHSLYTQFINEDEFKFSHIVDEYKIKIIKDKKRLKKFWNGENYCSTSDCLLVTTILILFTAIYVIYLSQFVEYFWKHNTSAFKQWNNRSRAQRNDEKSCLWHSTQKRCVVYFSRQQ